MVNWDKFRQDFPVTINYTYLANAAATPIPKPVYDEVRKFYDDILNQGDVPWDEWLKKIEQTREAYARFIGANSEEIAFTHSTSEGMNIIAHMLTPKGQVLSNNLEFPSSNLPWLNSGADFKLIKSRGGKILIEDILAKVNNKTKTILTSHVQYSTGYRQNLTELSKVTKNRGLYLVVNATQSLGALKFNVKDFDIDFMASDGHKWIMSSYGIGVLFVRKKHLQSTEFKIPFFSQLGQVNINRFDNSKLDISGTASRFELGSPHFPNIFCLNAALRYISSIGINIIESRILKLTDYLIERLHKLKVPILSPLEKKHRSGIVVFKIKNSKNAVKKLEKEKIIVSARGGGIRVSPHFYNNENDIDKLISALKI